MFQFLLYCISCSVLMVLLIVFELERFIKYTVENYLKEKELPKNKTDMCVYTVYSFAAITIWIILAPVGFPLIILNRIFGKDKLDEVKDYDGY